MNNCTFTGRAGADPKEHKFGNGDVTAEVSIATRYRKKNENGEWEDATQWIRLKVSGKQAEPFLGLVKQGAMITVRAEYRSKKVGEGFFDWFQVREWELCEKKKNIDDAPVTQNTDDDDLPF